MTFYYDYVLTTVNNVSNKILSGKVGEKISWQLRRQLLLSGSHLKCVSSVAYDAS